MLQPRRLSTSYGACERSRSSELFALNTTRGFADLAYLKIWDLRDQSLRCELKGHLGWICSLTFVNSDAILVSTSHEENVVRTWTVATGVARHTLRVPNVCNVVGSPHHPFVVAIVLRHPAIVICDAVYGKTFTIPQSGGGAVFTKLAPDRSSFITGSWDEETGLKIWDLQPLLDYWRPESSVAGLSLARGVPPKLVPTALPGTEVRRLASSS